MSISKTDNLSGAGNGIAYNLQIKLKKNSIVLPLQDVAVFDLSKDYATKRFQCHAYVWAVMSDLRNTFEHQPMVSLSVW